MARKSSRAYRSLIVHAALHLYLISSLSCVGARSHVVTLRCVAETSGRNLTRGINFSPSSSWGDPGGPIRNVFRWSICRPVISFTHWHCSPSLSLPLSSSLFFFSRYSRTSHRASKISKSLRSECRSRLIVTEAALDRFSNFVMTLKKWPPSRDVDRKRTFAHARERGVSSILNWYHMLIDSDLDWLSTGRFSYDVLMPRSDNFFYFTLNRWLIARRCTDLTYLQR